MSDKEYEAGFQLAEEISNHNAQCVNAFNTDLTLSYTTALGKKTFSGFLQYSPTTSYKFVMSNPLGQPILIIAGNQKNYQVINALESKYLSGGMTAFALKNNLPIHFLKGRWDDWITGKNTISTDYISDISSDRESRGIWITFEDNEGAKNISHLLIDPKTKIILERILETRQKKPVATIQYDNYFTDKSCSQPQHIYISGLKYGTTIDLQFSETELTSDIKTYNLKVPQGYLRQFRP